MKLNGMVQATSQVRESKLKGKEVNVGIKVGDTWYNLDGNQADVQEIKELADGARRDKRPIHFEHQGKFHDIDPASITVGADADTGGDKGDKTSDNSSGGPPATEERVDMNATKDERAITVTLYREALEDALSAFTAATGQDHVSWADLQPEERAGLMAHATSIKIDRYKRKY